MSQQSRGTSLFSPADPPRKRKRGRPRKDDIQLQGENLPIMPGSDSMKKNKQIVGACSAAIDDMEGQVVSGVIEGSFDAGYLLNVKVGGTDTQLRGVVFLPGRFTPITAANDVAPNAKMYKRKEIHIPVQNPPSQLHDFVPPSEQTNKQTAEYKMNAPKFPDQVPPPEVHSGIPTTVKNRFDFAMTPNFPDQIPPPVVESGGPTAGENQPDFAMTPLADKLPMKTGPALGEKVAPQLILDSGLANQTALIMAQLKNDKVVEQDPVQQDTVMEVDASKEMEPASALSESASAPIVDIMRCSKNVNQEPQGEDQPLSSDPKPSDLVHEEVKSLNVEDNHTSVLTKPTFISSETIGIGFLMGNQNLEYNQTPPSAEPKSISTQVIGTDFISERQNSSRKYMPEDALLELANEKIAEDETSLPVGRAANITSGGCDTSLSVGEAANNTAGGYDTSLSVGEAANITAGGYETSLPVGGAANTTARGSYSAAMTNLSVMMFGGDAISTEPKLGTEESVFPRINDTQICNSSADTNDVDPDLKAAMTHTHLDLSSGLNLSGSG